MPKSSDGNSPHKKGNEQDPQSSQGWHIKRAGGFSGFIILFTFVLCHRVSTLSFLRFTLKNDCRRNCVFGNISIK